MSESRTVTAAQGELLLHTDVTGKAARTGHRLTLRLKDWQADVTLEDGHPIGVQLSVDVDSLEVVKGEGGLTPMGAAEKMLARKNALKCLKADKHPRITYVSSAVQRDGDSYAVTGELTIGGVSARHPLTVVADGSSFRCESPVLQTAFGLKPYSQMMGALKVVDEVVVDISATL